jgi:hypothetical protein
MNNVPSPVICTSKTRWDTLREIPLSTSIDREIFRTVLAKAQRGSGRKEKSNERAFDILSSLA